MALPIYSIGDHTFFSLSGPPEKPVQSNELIIRPGVPGVGVYRFGKQGRPMFLRSEVDLTSKAAALAKYDEYQELIATDPIDAVWADQGFDAVRSCKIIVLDVRMAMPAPLQLATCVGGINVDDGDPGVWLACDWTVVSLAN